MKAGLNFSHLFESEGGRPRAFVAILLALATTAVLVTELPDDVALRGRVVGALAAAFLASVAAGRLAAARRWPLASDLAGQVALAALAAAAVWFARPWSVFQPTFYAGLVIAGAAAALLRLRSAASYWVWLERLQDETKLPLAGTLAGWVAFSATLWSAHLLFDLFTNKTIATLNEKSAAILFCAVLPIALVTRAPPIADAPPKDAEDFLRRAQARIAHWALAPFVLAYSALLWLYAGKIALLWTLPANEIGRMVGAFGVVAVFTLFLIFPDRDKGPPHVRLLWRIWPYLLPAPLVLVALAIAARIEAHGLTPDRYVAISLIALLAAAGAVALTGRERFIRFSPAAATLVLLAASLGPFGAIETSARWQTATLTTILTAHGLLKDGKLVEEAEPAALSAAESKQWSSAIEFLKQYDRLPLFGAARASDAWMAERRLRALVRQADLRPESLKKAGLRNPSRYCNLTDKQWAALPEELEQFSLAGQALYREGDAEPKNAANARVSLDKTRLSIGWRDEPASIFDLTALARRIDAGCEKLGPELLAPSSGSGEIRLLIDTLSLRNDEEGPAVTFLRAFILKARPKG